MLCIMPTETFHEHLSRLRRQVESALSSQLQAADWPQNLRDAVEYSLLAGGKRLRPVLVLLANELCGGSDELALPAACAIEMIHTYSLIHDDLPSMDNDDFRRGRPTSHKVFGEALAILAGDCLLTQAFEVLAAAPVDPARRIELVRVLAAAAGGSGMVGGQILDLEAERSHAPDLNRVDHLTRIHTMKTGALIAAALELGAVCGNADRDSRQRLRQFGYNIGLAFQIADDLLDVTGDDARLGKVTGRDADLGKLTYPALLGVDASRQRAAELIEQACQLLSPWGAPGLRLRELARFIVERDH